MTIGDAGRSSGDMAYRVSELERQMRDMLSARRLESASIGSGGLRVRGGRILAENTDGQRIFEVRSEPPEIFLQQDLVTDLTRTILGEAIRADENIVSGSTTTEDDWVDLTFGGSPDPGPSVEVDIGPSGRALVFTSAHIAVGEFGSGTMSFVGSGPQSIAPQALSGAFNSVAMEPGGFTRPGSTGIRLLAGLTPGNYTLTAKYRVSNQSFGSGISFSNRTLVAIAF